MIARVCEKEISVDVNNVIRTAGITSNREVKMGREVVRDKIGPATASTSRLLNPELNLLTMKYLFSSAFVAVALVGQTSGAGAIRGANSNGGDLGSAAISSWLLTSSVLCTRVLPLFGALVSLASNLAGLGGGPVRQASPVRPQVDRRVLRLARQAVLEASRPSARVPLQCPGRVPAETDLDVRDAEVVQGEPPDLLHVTVVERPPARPVPVRALPSPAPAEAAPLPPPGEQPAVAPPFHAVVPRVEAAADQHRRRVGMVTGHVLESPVVDRGVEAPRRLHADVAVELDGRAGDQARQKEGGCEPSQPRPPAEPSPPHRPSALPSSELSLDDLFTEVLRPPAPAGRPHSLSGLFLSREGMRGALDIQRALGPGITERHPERPVEAHDASIYDIENLTAASVGKRPFSAETRRAADRGPSRGQSALIRLNLKQLRLVG
ncbi:hypothetical protein THAOC_15274 [Thalassiosira oceanica]|uniref:Uncharacterized protein n=1 Tax=Thalassiosira oceanica TaxID=159749 RepID=K0SF79_THAOC|nr:hypothetical protein THAOC_15274 [Thalassiosira oceanica]|eukprot:EJK64035.1 hypothetical protein THAOC_15274 [Thalassiosira oceanica]